MEKIEISSAKELSRINSDEEKEFILTDDIDLAVLENKYNIVQNFLRKHFNFYVSFPIEELNGILNGQGHSIKNLKLRRYKGDDTAFVKENNGTIKNLTIENIDIQSSGTVGGIAVINNGKIENCSVSGSLNCFSEEFNNYKAAGGICSTNKGEVINCEVKGIHINGEAGVGGISGKNKNKIEKCSSCGKIMGKVQCGGICGNNTGLVKRCDSDMDVNGEESVGGLIGRNNTSNAYVRDSYFTGNVMREGVGGIIVALNLYGRVENCFWKKEYIGLDPIGSGWRDNGDVREIEKIDKDADLEKRVLIGKI